MSAYDFEIRYIEAQWYDKHTLINLVESIHPLKIEQGEAQNSFKAYTTIYPKIDEMDKCNFAIHFNVEPEVTPYILSPNGTQTPLMKVINPRTKKIWWTEGTVWLKKYKRWGTQAFRTAGTIKIISGEKTFEVYIGLSDDSEQALNRYLASFKDDLWELILDDNSYVGGKAKRANSGGIDESVLKLISNLLTHAKLIVSKPKAELREIQSLKDRKQVKPVPRTFMELSTKGNAKRLTSRGTEPSYNVPENKYIHYVISSTYKLIKQLVQISSSKGSRYQGNIEQLNKRLNALKDHRTINKDLVYKDLRVLEDFCNEHKLKLSDELNQQLEQTKSVEFQDEIYIYYIKVTGEVNNSENTYFVEYKYYENSQWVDENTAGTTKYLNITPVSYVGLKIGFEYQINMAVVRNQGVGKNGKPYERLNVKHVDFIKILPTSDQLKKLEKYQKDIEKLEQSNWIRALSRKELAEQQKERKSIVSRIHFFETALENANVVLKSLDPKIKAFKTIEKAFKKLGIKTSSSFPNSMTFVQNQDYQYAHTSYRKIREQIGLADDDLLLSLERIDSIGLINMPILYERWCLLQVVKSLLLHFHFTSEPTWKRKLIRMIQSPKTNESLIFQQRYTCRAVKLEYEPLFDNGRTPDFMIGIGARRKQNHDKIQYKNFVIDAKYHSSEFLASEGGIAGVVYEMAHDRNYSENGQNSVYIIQPTLDAITAIGGPISPQAWAKTSYLGELKLFDWDHPRKIHQYGAVSANPTKSIRYLDEFNRLLGMFLQYSIEDSYKCQGADDVSFYNFCIACGSSNLTKNPIPQSDYNNRKVNQKKRWYTCNNCFHHTTYNHCHKCNTRLIKNGEYWTYHSMMPMEPTNIKCPSCEEPV